MIRVVCIRSKGPRFRLRVEEMHRSAHGFQGKKVYPRDLHQAIHTEENPLSLESNFRHGKIILRIRTILTILVEEGEPKWMDCSQFSVSARKSTQSGIDAGLRRA